MKTFINPLLSNRCVYTLITKLTALNINHFHTRTGNNLTACWLRVNIIALHGNVSTL